MYYCMPFFNPCKYCRTSICYRSYRNYRTLNNFCMLQNISSLSYYTEFQNANRQTKEFSLSELANYNGSMGKPAYVAVNGTVYDVSNEATWGGASHFGLIAGKDLSSQFQGCHGNESVLAKLPKVGILKG